jgi:hypothetical protein
VVESQLFVQGSSEAVRIAFDTLILRFPVSNQWSGASWELVTGASVIQFTAPSLAEIAGLAERFEARIVDGEGTCHGPFLITTVICGFPHSTFCFLFHADSAGMWSGHTVTTSFGRIVIVPYRTDPT